MPASETAATSRAPRRKWYHPLALLERLVIYAVIGYVTICVYLYAMQTSLIYVGMTPGFTTPQAIAQAAHYGLVPWPESPANSPDPAPFEGFVPRDFTHPAPRGTIVLFQGNGGWALDRIPYIEAFTPRGFRTLLFAYPGYGGRPGTPSEKTIVPDARALIRSLDAAGYGPVYVWGESLGAGVAAAVCADPTLPVHGLVLLTPWDTIGNVAQSYYPWIPVKLLMHDKYDSIANLTGFQHPICVIRSENDEIIPPRLSLNLYAHLPEPKKLILQPGVGHNDWPRDANLPWWDDALNFIAPK